MSNQDKKHESLSSAVGTAGSTLLGAFAAALGLPLPEIVGLTVAGQLLGALGYDSLARRGETFLSTFRRELHEGHERDFDAEVRERAKDPNFRSVTYQVINVNYSCRVPTTILAGRRPVGGPPLRRR